LTAAYVLIALSDFDLIVTSFSVGFGFGCLFVAYATASAKKRKD
tara:strand:- start:4164 stop:4295 length:132 start_codon:yes stop_codon:yes gene_type:complete